VLQHNKPDEDLQRKIYIYVFQFDANNWPIIAVKPVRAYKERCNTHHVNWKRRRQMQKTYEA
jgi:hypothetical protein